MITPRQVAAWSRDRLVVRGGGAQRLVVAFDQAGALVVSLDEALGSIRVERAPWAEVAAWALDGVSTRSPRAPWLGAPLFRGPSSWGAGDLAIAEGVAVACALRLPVRFSYRKSGARGLPASPRRGWVSKVEGATFGGVDADRGGYRRFSLEGVDEFGIAIGARLPTWTDGAWTFESQALVGEAA